jgi:hypothetical protein
VPLLFADSGKRDKNSTGLSSTEKMQKDSNSDPHRKTRKVPTETQAVRLPKKVET